MGLTDDGSLLAVAEAMVGRVDPAVPHDTIGVGEPCGACADLRSGDAYQRRPVVSAQESSSGRRAAGKVASQGAMATVVRHSGAPAKTPTA
ncbi:hypothetical protein Aph02nite_64650 [Actinoplanes philippinensis]|nr:hypothetical protein Aph02nite_64650 [Actinoplanes philippinensis]